MGMVSVLTVTGNAGDDDDIAGLGGLADHLLECGCVGLAVVVALGVGDGLRGDAGDFGGARDDLFGDHAYPLDTRRRQWDG
jgi:hypothetical protein